MPPEIPEENAVFIMGLPLLGASLNFRFTFDIETKGCTAILAYHRSAGHIVATISLRPKPVPLG
jgi:hypothetical protein